MDILQKTPLAELHAHLGTSISAQILWQIAHQSGFKLPKREFSEFREYIMLSPQRKIALNDYFEQVYHPFLDYLSAGAQAVEQATYHTISGAYHRQNITVMELRNNPVKHSRFGEFDYDYVIMAMLRGMERALLECSGLSAGLIFCLGRDLTYEQNVLIIEKAIKYRRRGVIGVDVAGPPTKGFIFKDYTKLFNKARKAGLKLTVHTGEAKDANDTWQALEHLSPERIGHGILAAYDKPLMKELVRRKVVLEICPMSNIMTKAVENVDEMKFVLRTLIENKVRFCINTDWPEMIEGCRLRRQMEWLHAEGLLSAEEIAVCNRTAFEASFVPKPGGLESYL